MVRMGKIFRRSFGDRSFNTPNFSKTDKRQLREIQKRVRERKAIDFYGKKYNSLNPSQKRFIKEKAERLIAQGAKE